MKTVKTSELTGAALDWAVAKTEGKIDRCGEVTRIGNQLLCWEEGERMRYAPSDDWSQGGPIIEREMIRLTPKCTLNPLHRWVAAYRSFDEDDDFYVLHRKRGKTPLHAAMRCYVASKMGDAVEVPEELL